MAEAEDYGARDRPHIRIDAFREPAQYAFPARAQQRKPLRADYAAHAKALIEQLAQALGSLPATGEDTRFPIEGLRLGTVVEVTTLAPPEESRARTVKVPSKLEFPALDLVVLRTERHDNRTESALLFVPDAARVFLRDRIAAYGRDPGNARRPDVDRFEAIERVSAAPIHALFLGDIDFRAPETVWWELWVQGGAGRAERVAVLARSSDLDVHADRLYFPETSVIFVHASAGSLAAFVARVPGAVTEIRLATGTIEPFLSRRPVVRQQDWVTEFASRLVSPANDVPVVCTLDTGVAAAHPLVAPGLTGAWAYDSAWGTHDHAPAGGHGTAMAGLVLFGDLESHMSGSAPAVLSHGVESMKLLPPQGFPATKPPSYGVVTQGAVAKVEVERPGRSRTFCLAISATDFPPSRPSSWSGAIDQIAAGSMPGDAIDGVPASEAPKRLVLVATGNVSGGSLIDVVESQPLEDPSQSWNALTIGGFTRKEQFPTPPPILEPVVPANHRSPFSRGSQSLATDLTPIKPEVLFEAGNMVYDDSGFCRWHEAVSLLAPGADVVAEPLIPFWATSAATGMAGNFIGRLQGALPNLWPETYRALTVDSASWPQPMRKHLVGRGAHWKTGSKAKKQLILREVGYGVPDVDRAIQSARNDVTMIAQSMIQPFAVGTDGKSGVFNEMHFYDLPWPASALQQFENEIVTMKVTLSYFVEPNLTGKAATRPETYRSFGLRFAMRKRNETEAAFRSRVSAAQEGDGSEVESETDCWLLGPKAIQAGSLHCDVWRGFAVDLAAHSSIAVYPVSGWWKSHFGQRRVEDTARYALVVSISAPGMSVDLHAQISNIVELQEIEAMVQ